MSEAVDRPHHQHSALPLWLRLCWSVTWLLRVLPRWGDPQLLAFPTLWSSPALTAPWHFMQATYVPSPLLCFDFLSLWTLHPVPHQCMSLFIDVGTMYVSIPTSFFALPFVPFFCILPRRYFKLLCFFLRLEFVFLWHLLIPHFFPCMSSCLLNPFSKPHLSHLSFLGDRPSCFPFGSCSL